MPWIIFKFVITSGLIVVISEIAKRNDKLGGLISALPLITLITLFWLYIEDQPMSKISNHAYYTFWYVIPTLPMFLILPFLLSKYGFWFSISISMLVTIACFAITAHVLKYFGIFIA
jgi:hypothetical protein